MNGGSRWSGGSRRERVRTDIVNWIEGFHNRRRLHTAIVYRKPIQLELRLMAA
jgi:hypothetical protein